MRPPSPEGADAALRANQRLCDWRPGVLHVGRCMNACVTHLRKIVRASCDECQDSEQATRLPGRNAHPRTNACALEPPHPHARRARALACAGPRRARSAMRPCAQFCYPAMLPRSPSRASFLLRVACAIRRHRVGGASHVTVRRHQDPGLHSCSRGSVRLVSAGRARRRRGQGRRPERTGPES